MPNKVFGQSLVSLFVGKNKRDILLIACHAIAVAVEGFGDTAALGIVQNPAEDTRSRGSKCRPLHNSAFA